MAETYFPFRPALEGPFAKRFYDRARVLADRGFDLAQTQEVLQHEVDWAEEKSNINPHQRRIYRAAWLLLGDLVSVGWQARWHEGNLELAEPRINENPKTEDEIRLTKDQIRQAMHSARVGRILEAADFVRRMENPPEGALAQVPISALIADPRQLATDLAGAIADSATAGIDVPLQAVVKPYLQLVEEGKRCELTGHKISDIWRYFRFTWRTAAENTPGRTLLYLIRDASRAYHPVMGISSLENCPLRITCRDEFLGWTPAAFASQVAASETPRARRRLVERLLRNIDDAVSAIDASGLCQRRELLRPSESVLLKLAGIVSSSIADREQHLRDWRCGDHEEEDRSELGNISIQAEEALYRRKRAEQLGRLLSAKITLTSIRASPDFGSRYQTLLSADAARSAVHQALVAIKNRFIGTSMMELNVCGAIPPYSMILGGKLVALLMLSPQVVEDYRNRYGKRASDIASRMKNEDVIRPADLVFLGTTSLFRVGAAQYNRLKLPAGLFGAASTEVRWERIGETRGYGTWHISRRTLESFNEILRAGSLYEINHVFGEGASPKLRAIRKALDIVFERGERDSTEAFARHTMSRLVFGAWLAKNGTAVFSGVATRPAFYFGAMSAVADQTKPIVSYWVSRWMAPRLRQHADTFQHLADFEKSSLLVGQLLESVPAQASIAIEGMDNMDSTTSPQQSNPEPSGLEFLTKLYRGTTSFADGTDLAQLHAIHVQTSLDDAICKSLQAGLSVVLTGNPGDGKTHILRVLGTRLGRIDHTIEPVLDASALSNEAIISQWRKAATGRHPFCVAINAAVLKQLADENPGFPPVMEAQSQVETAVFYGDDVPQDPHEVVVFDLSRRNILASEIVNAVATKLASPEFLGLAKDTLLQDSDVARNAALLITQRFRDRLQAVLDRVNRRGYHATLRELQALVAFLLLGGRDRNDVIRDSGNWQHSLPQLPYQGQGRLFREISTTFDPFNVTHPLWDEDLIAARTRVDDWLDHWHNEVEAIQPDNIERFKARKRAFFFLHAAGDVLLRIAKDLESDFATFLALPDRDALRQVFAGINAFFLQGDSRSESLRVWQCHRFANVPRRVLCSDRELHRRDFAILHPQLRPSMAKAFQMASDHRLVRYAPVTGVHLKIDFAMFRLLTQSARGFPSLYLDEVATRRLWQFMERLDGSHGQQGDECDVAVHDTTKGLSLTVTVDTVARKYIHLRQGQL